jgi:hypothetical protein
MIPYPEFRTCPPGHPGAEEHERFIAKNRLPIPRPAWWGMAFVQPRLKQGGSSQKISQKPALIMLR